MKNLCRILIVLVVAGVSPLLTPEKSFGGLIYAGGEVVGIDDISLSVGLRDLDFTFGSPIANSDLIDAAAAITATSDISLYLNGFPAVVELGSTHDLGATTYTTFNVADTTGATGDYSSYVVPWTPNGSPVAFGGSALFVKLLPSTTYVFGAVPEPATASILGMMGVGLLGIARRRRKQVAV